MATDNSDLKYATTTTKLPPKMEIQHEFEIIIEKLKKLMPRMTLEIDDLTLQQDLHALSDPNESVEIKIGKRFQFVLPKLIRKKMNLKEGDRLMLSVNMNGELEGKKFVSLPSSQLAQNYPILQADIKEAVNDFLDSDFLSGDEFNKMIEG